MHHFLRVIKFSLRYKWSVVASVVNALLIGVLWSVSISTIYPILEISFSGHTFPDWIDHQIEEREETALTYRNEIDRSSKILEKAPDDSDALESAGRARNLLSEDEQRIKLYRSLQKNITPYLPESPFGTLTFMMSLVLILTILKGGCIVSQAVLVSRISHGTIRDLRRIFFRSILSMDQLKVDKMGSSKMMTMLSHNINLVGSGLQALYCQSIREPFKMLACLIGAALISWQLLLISMIITPIGILSLWKMKQLVKTATHKHMGGVAVILQTLAETIICLKIVKIFNRERTEMKRFRNNAESLYGLCNRMNFYDAILNPLTETLGLMALAITILCGGWLVMNQETHLWGFQISDRPLTPSLMFLFFGLLAGVSGPARKLTGVYNTIVRACMASETLYDVFDRSPDIIASKSSNSSSAPLAHEIRFDDVIFTYGIMHRVLKHISFTIPKGQTVAFVGHNGCGKSTLMNLVARFYDPTAGNIYFDDVNIREFHPRSLRRQISMVTQDAFLFDGTIGDNIAYGNADATIRKVVQAADLAMVTDFIKDLPNGWETKIGDGGKRLSGGQRQRVAIARAIVGNPQILILDEATSQIDPIAETELHKRLAKYLKDRTVFMISHRTSTLELADRVIVMESGWVKDDMPAKRYLKNLPKQFIDNNNHKAA